LGFAAGAFFGYTAGCALLFAIGFFTVCFAGLAVALTAGFFLLEASMLAFV